MSTPEAPLDQPYYGAPITAAFTRFWRKYAVFTGRASRSEYWWWALIAGVIGIVLQIIAQATGSASSTSTTSSTGASFHFADTGPIGVVIGLWALATILPSLALMARRLHDGNHSALFLLLLLIPLVGAIVIFVFVLMPSRPEGQRFDAASTRGTQQPDAWSQQQPGGPQGSPRA